MKPEEEKTVEELDVLKKRFGDSLMAFDEIYNSEILSKMGEEELLEEDVRTLLGFVTKSDALKLDLFDQVIVKNHKYTDLTKLEDHDESLDIGDDAWIVVLIENAQKKGNLTDPKVLKKILKLWPSYFVKMKLILEKI